MKSLFIALLVLVLSAPGSLFATERITRDIGSEDPDYSSLDRSLNASAADGKLAGEIGMEAPFVDNYSGGLGGEIGATIDAQNELENKDFVGSDN
jgi:hypothetical protein